MRKLGTNKTTIKLKVCSGLVFMCCILYYLTSNSFPQHSLSSQIPTNSQFSPSIDTEEPAFNTGGLSQPIPSASKFENNSQFANWFEVEHYFTRFQSADDHLIKKEPIHIDWFLQVACDRHWVSGWKSCNLLYKFINALI
jgi:hypothetical protein